MQYAKNEKLQQTAVRQNENHYLYIHKCINLEEKRKRTKIIAFITETLICLRRRELTAERLCLGPNSLSAAPLAQVPEKGLVSVGSTCHTVDIQPHSHEREQSLG